MHKRRLGEPTPVKVTVCELSDDRKAFARDWEGLKKHVQSHSSDFVLLPEMPFSSWFCASPKPDPKVWKEVVGEHTRWMKRLPELGANVVLGSRPVDKEGKRLNEGFMWTQRTGARGVHDKAYLPNEEGYYEASWYQRGDGEFALFGASGSKLGMMVCSDIWAMPHARAYGKAGGHIIAVPICVPRGSMERWLAAAKVVAMVSGAYCIGSNRTGRGPGFDFGGSSWIVDPNGKVLGMTSRSKKFATAEVHRAVADKAKKTYPRDALSRTEG
jgi:N-carbamoylputrescine amidase